jgi:hypothetical protein
MVGPITDNMRRLTLRLSITALTFIIGVFTVFLWLPHRPQPRHVNEQPTDHAERVDSGHVSFRGVSFIYSPELASEVKSEVKPKDFAGKLCDVVPEHAAFTLRYAGSGPEMASFFSPPELNIYNITEYKKAFAQFEILSRSSTKPYSDWTLDDEEKAEHEAEQMAEESTSDIEEIKTLSGLLSQKPLGNKLARVLWGRYSLVSGEIPILPIFEATQNFYAQVKYISFRNGKGILFLTHYAIDPDIIRNHGLAYVFQGITDDGKYYVSAFFPVKAPILQDFFGDSAILENKYHLDYRHRFSRRFQQNYKRYVLDTKRALERVPNSEFTPALPLFEELLRSLSVQEQNQPSTEANQSRPH